LVGEKRVWMKEGRKEGRKERDMVVFVCNEEKNNNNIIVIYNDLLILK
jgi:hypothetical protein